MQAIAYIRVSTDDQRLGLDAQRAAIETWARASGAEIAAWHVDHGVSGAAPIEDRPGLSGAMAALQRGSVLIVAKRDRIARDIVIAATVERVAARMGASVVSTAGEGNGTSPADEFMRTVIDGAAAYERALIRARTKAALAIKRARGECTGAVPYGYRADADGRLTRDDAETEIVSVVRELAAAGYSRRGIVSELAARGVVGRTGRALGLTQVQRMIMRRYGETFERLAGA